MQPPSDEAERARVRAALAGIEAAVRQRHGEAAALGGGSEDASFAVAELRRHEFVLEPAPVSPRPIVGPLLVLLRKASYHLVVKWHARSVWAQQNAFNQSASRLVQELAERVRGLEVETDRLRRRVRELERADGDEPRGEA